MKHLLAFLALAVFLPTRHAAAELVNRGGGLVYDTVLDITWLRDANLALTNTFGISGIDSDGSMDWQTAQAWIDAMNASNYLGYSDWRLPNIEPIGSEYNYLPSFDGSTDYSIGITSAHSELAYMFSVNLENVDHLVNDRTNPNDESLFRNLACANPREFCPTFWSGNEYEANPYFPIEGDAAWVFDMSTGWQSGDYASKRYYVWAVRDGDVIRGTRHHD